MEGGTLYGTFHIFQDRKLFGTYVIYLYFLFPNPLKKSVRNREQKANNFTCTKLNAKYQISDYRTIKLILYPDLTIKFKTL